MPIMAFKIEGKEMNPSLFSESVVGQCTPQVRLGKHAPSKQKSHDNTTAVSCEVYVHALLVQHLYSMFFQHGVG